MFCRKCGQELPDDSAFCNKCGVQTSDAETTPVGEESLAKKVPKWPFIVVAVLLLIFIAYASTTTNNLNNAVLDSASLCDTDLGVYIALGQTKSKVDEAFGEPAIVFDRYDYPHSMEAEFIDGKVVKITATMESCWETGDGFTENTTMDEVRAAYGEPNAEASNELLYVFDITGAPTASAYNYYADYIFSSNRDGEYTLRGVIISNQFTN